MGGAKNAGTKSSAIPQQQSVAAVADTGVACLIFLARYFEVTADASQIEHEFCDGVSALNIDQLSRAARSLSLKTKIASIKADRLESHHLPAIAENRGGEFVILARIVDGRVLIQDPKATRPTVVSFEEFARRWTGRLLLITKRASLGEQFRRFDLSWFLPAIFRHKKIFSQVLMASFFIQLFGLITPLFFQVVVDKVLVHRGFTTLDVLIFGLVAVSLFEVLLTGLRAYLYAHTTSRIDVALGAKLFSHLLALPLAYFNARRVGDSVARARELESIRDFITGNSMTVVLDLLFTFVFLAVMWIYSSTLTLIVLASIPCYVILSIVVTPIFRRRLEEKFQRGAENQAFLVETVSGVETLKAMAVEPQMRRRWEDQLAGYVAASFRTNVLGNIGQQVAGLINKLTVAATLWFGARLVIDNQLTVGELVAFNMLAGRVSQPVLRLAQLWQDFQQVRISVDRLGDILNTPAEPAFNPSRGTLPAIKGEVRFDHVSFRYRPDAQEVLSDIDLTVAPGQVLGVVGPSGSGKSTLTKLIQRLHLPERGRVLIDGVDLAMVDTAWLRRQIGVVLQENVLFNRTVRENIALSAPGTSLETVIQAAKLAGAHEFILEMPYGYDTEIGERGSTLSGGQRQRIAIARALITNPRILIFDEATSALDYESERIIQDNMRRICKGRTVIIIAHRLAAVRTADRIITVEAGRLTEDGNHETLLKEGGRYAQLHRYQTGDVEPAQAAE